MKGYVLAIVAITATALAASALAHHREGPFDLSKEQTYKGVVTKLEWQNPHCWLYMDVKDEKSGETRNYGFELGPPHLLQGQTPSLTKDSLKIKSEVTVVGVPYPGYNGLRVAATKVTPKQKPMIGIFNSVQ